MRGNQGAPRKRRSIDNPRRSHLLRVQISETVRERLESLSDRYNVTCGTIASAAIEAGLRATAERLRRNARAEARNGGAASGRAAADE